MVFLLQNYAPKNMHGIVFTLPMWSFTRHLLRSIMLYRDKSVIIVISFAYPIPSSQIHLENAQLLLPTYQWKVSEVQLTIHHWTRLSFARLSGAHWQYESELSRSVTLRILRLYSYRGKSATHGTEFQENPTNSATFHTRNTLPKNSYETKQKLQNILIACNPSILQD